jgi:hypothetical protein
MVVRLVAALIVSAGASGAAASDVACASIAGASPRQKAEPSLQGGVRIPASALLTFRTDEVRMAERRTDRERAIELTLHEDQRPPVLLARVRVPAGTDGPVHIAWSPGAGNAAAASQASLTGLEVLYGFLVGQDPLRQYRLQVAGTDRASKPQSHGAALQTLARWRGCVLAQLRASNPDFRAADWETVSLRLRPAPASGLRIAAQVRRTDGSPVVNAPVAFMRGSHLACDSRTTRDGTTACELFDVHGHAHHDDEVGEPVTVTFAGVVQADRVLLPTTLVVRHRKASRR